MAKVSLRDFYGVAYRPSRHGGGQPRRPMRGYADANVSVQPVITADQGQMDQVINELSAALTKAKNARSGSVYLVGGANTAASVDAAIKLSEQDIDLLMGDLYQAAIGNHNFPLDTGTSPDPQTALNIWNKIAQDTRETLQQVIGFNSKWSALPTIKTISAAVAQGLQKGVEDLANPLKWPLWMKLLGGAGALYLLSQVLKPAAEIAKAASQSTRNVRDTAREARDVWEGRQRQLPSMTVSGYKKKRRK